MTKGQTMIEANFNLYVGYLKFVTEKKLATQMLKDAGMSSEEIEDYIEMRLESIKETIAMDSF